MAFKDKLGESFRPYSILGACNPRLAFRALSRRPEAGLMLPCNVVVESNPEGGSIIRILDPVAAIKGSTLGEDEEIGRVAAEAAAALERVAASLR